ncbi:SDR family NAD(P)-dependent oxidoreductase [Nocardia grenadensis]|uniref:SDR family NAD(P)-dependent oxidoreductase n=1 Tax=Nocardia grenadensis TaxID=931537 RepID=UPI0007A52D30|nr:SDR family NAD(P)-dependent oxidoreductase [Nocardia grenadensis]
MDLSNKVAVVTGSGRGLGLAYAKDLARHGAAVVINDVDKETADKAVAEIRALGGRTVAVVAPVGPTETAQQLVATAVEEFGRLDIMVTNAGILRDAVVWKTSDEAFDAVNTVHLRGTFTCVREAVLRFRAQGAGGRIICIGSPAGQRGNFGQTSYSGAKAAIVGMVRTWSMELQRAGITANAVCPVAATAMTETMPIFRPHIESAKKTGTLPALLRRDIGLGTADDAAGIITFLASDEAADITGQAFAIGGDRVALWTHPQLSGISYHDNGWSAEDLAAEWPNLSEHRESVGEEFPAELTGGGK